VKVQTGTGAAKELATAARFSLSKSCAIRPRQAVGNRMMQPLKRLAEYSDLGATLKPEFTRGNLRKE
jgi:hypothetical protein